MAYLTRQLAFPEEDASQALSRTSGTDLGEALDFLCLHTDEAGLKKAFRTGTANDGGGSGRRARNRSAGGEGFLPGGGIGAVQKGRDALASPREPTIEVGQQNTERYR